MKQIKNFFMIMFILAITAGYALAEDLIIFPKQGQSNDQIEKDKFACYSWAKQQSGFDPMSTPPAAEPAAQAEAPKGGVIKGAARGAVVGVAAGAIAGDAGKGAAIGATSGGLIGGMRRHSQVTQQEQTQNNLANQQAQQYAKNRDTYNRAYAACLEGKGYTVK